MEPNGTGANRPLDFSRLRVATQKRGSNTSAVHGVGAPMAKVPGLPRLDQPVRPDLLELAVFERIDASLVDEVLGSSDARLRVSARPELGGLLLPVDEDGDMRGLHPLEKEYCVDRLSAEDPIRMRSLHARIARVLSRRDA